MPGGDRTGPAGLGPMTGRAVGYCAGYSAPGFHNPFPGRGFWGWGRGGGRGRHRRFYPTVLLGRWHFGARFPAYSGAEPYETPIAPTLGQEQELDMLKGQAKYFEEALGGIKERIAELEAESKT
ncbi:DUF5320 domain-containing protein [Planctomycetota bacterium]